MTSICARQWTKLPATKTAQQKPSRRRWKKSTPPINTAPIRIHARHSRHTAKCFFKSFHVSRWLVRQMFLHIHPAVISLYFECGSVVCFCWALSGLQKCALHIFSRFSFELRGGKKLFLVADKLIVGSYFLLHCKNTHFACWANVVSVPSHIARM